jgi:hypothetical protein
MANEFFNINTFRQNLNSGSRANLFRCRIEGLNSNIDDPEQLLGSKEDSRFTFLCRSAAIPAYSLGIIEVPFRGRRIKIPGDRTFAEWTVTVLNDEKQGMRKVFDNWMSYINNPNGQEAIRETSTDDYRCTVVIEHLRGDGTISRVYNLVDAFPTDVSPIDLSYDTTDAIQEFSVTFQYHFMDGGNVTSTGDDAAAPTFATSSL